MPNESIVLHERTMQMMYHNSLTFGVSIAKYYDYILLLLSLCSQR